MNDPATIRPALLALAAWTELEATCGRIIAETLRNDAKAVEKLRVMAHDLLDQHIDGKIEGVAAMRERVKRQLDRL